MYKILQKMQILQKISQKYYTKTLLYVKLYIISNAKKRRSMWSYLAKRECHEAVRHSKIPTECSRGADLAK